MTERLKAIGRTVSTNGVANTISSVAKGIAATVYSDDIKKNTARHRLEQCRKCPFIRDADTQNTAHDRPWCGVCGCDLKAKTALMDHHCPLGTASYPEVAHLQQQW